MAKIVDIAVACLIDCWMAVKVVYSTDRSKAVVPVLFLCPVYMHKFAPRGKFTPRGKYTPRGKLVM